LIDPPFETQQEIRRHKKEMQRLGVNRIEIGIGIAIAIEIGFDPDPDFDSDFDSDFDN